MSQCSIVDQQDLVAASIAYQLYFKLSSRVQKTSGDKPIPRGGLVAYVLPELLKAIASTQMEAKTSQSETASHTASPLMLSSLNWRVWFLGYGLGGCFGLTLLAGVWSLLVDEKRMLGLSAIAISLAHGFTLVMFWLKRSTTLAGSATKVCYLAGALGIALVAWLLTSCESRVPGLASLYCLALMSLVLAFTIPPLAQSNSGRTKAGRLPI